MKNDQWPSTMSNRLFRYTLSCIKNTEVKCKICPTLVYKDVSDDPYQFFFSKSVRFRDVGKNYHNQNQYATFICSSRHISARKL